MKYIIILLAVVTFTACNDKKETKTTEMNQEELVDKSKDETNLVDDPEEEGTKMLVGKIKVSDLFTERFAWFEKEFDTYTPDEEVTAKLEEALKGKEIIVFMGTWCEDSQREVPRLTKILMKINHLTGPQIVAVNRDKEVSQKWQAFGEIAYVPTIIIVEKGTELGRVVESTQETLEKDLLKIASGQDYKHIYEE